MCSQDLLVSEKGVLAVRYWDEGRSYKFISKTDLGISSDNVVT